MFYNAPQYHWSESISESVTCSYKGSKNFAARVQQVLETNKPTVKILNSIFQEQLHYTSGVAETESHIVAWVDHIRSWPLLYSTHNGDFIISNEARIVQKQAGYKAPDEDSVLEFVMAGYIQGAHTLYKDLFCLEPGEFLIWDKETKTLQKEFYFQYKPNMRDHNPAYDDTIAGLSNIIDEIMREIIDRANGRPIWIPLSAGLDSRIILCKLHEFGYPNIHTYTYGPRFNFEAKYAKRIAKTLNVPWQFVALSAQKSNRYYNSDEAHNFWDYTDDLKAIPSTQEFAALKHLRDTKQIPDDAIIINGQSGDYITGNHIAPLWKEDKNHAKETLLEVLIGKHYGLWLPLLTIENKNKIAQQTESRGSNFSLKPQMSSMELAEAEEAWEYNARQICMVVNGQKLYDFYNYDWELPLWDKRLVEFCENLPFDQKFGQKFYKDYLCQYNYKGLFPEKIPYIWRWPLYMIWVIPTAQLIKLMRGKEAKDNFYAYMRYYGHYSNQYAGFSWQEHKKTALISRNVVSLNVRKWVAKNKAFFDKKIIEILKLDDQ